ncbi:MAG: type IV secretion system DNA-binding domain-containing protein, partial [Steroidobacteraceae bacterium]
YGHAEAQTIVENCGNTLILRCSASERGGTSRFASQLIGQREVVRTTESRTRRAMRLLPSITRSEHFNIEPAVLDSEIEQLPDLKGYLKFASGPQWRRVALSPPEAALADDGPSRIRTDARKMWATFRGGESSAAKAHTMDHRSGGASSARGQAGPPPDSFGL